MTGHHPEDASRPHYDDADLDELLATATDGILSKLEADSIRMPDLPISTRAAQQQIPIAATPCPLPRAGTQNWPAPAESCKRCATGSIRSTLAWQL